MGALSPSAVELSSLSCVSTKKARLSRPLRTAGVRRAPGGMGAGWVPAEPWLRYRARGRVPGRRKGALAFSSPGFQQPEGRVAKPKEYGVGESVAARSIERRRARQPGWGCAGPGASRVCSPASPPGPFRMSRCPFPSAAASPRHARVGGGISQPFPPAPSPPGAGRAHNSAAHLHSSENLWRSPRPRSIKFSQKRLSGRSSRERPASQPEALTFSEPSGSRLPTAPTPPPTYSPGPC